MIVRWCYEGLNFKHTEDESPDPDDHEWQGPMAPDELIVHAANLYLFRSDTDERHPRALWSLAHASRRAIPFEEPKRVQA